MNYRARYQGRLYRVSFATIIVSVSNHTVETEEDAQLLETMRGE